MEELTIAQAAVKLSLSEKTIRTRLANGRYQGRKVSTPGGFRWILELEPLESPQAPQDNHTEGTGKVIELLTAQVTELQRQLEVREREIGQLHILLGQKALSEGKQAPWWMLWRK